MIIVQQLEQEYQIRFPYDAELIEHVKNVPGRMWHPDTRCWTIPLARLGFFIAQVKGTKYENQLQIHSDQDININASINEPNKIPDIDVSEYTYRVQTGLKPYKHQIDSLKFAKWRYENGLKSGFLLADEPGCISGNSFVRIKEENKGWTRECTLSNLYKLFKSGKHVQIKTLEAGRFVYKPIANVIDKGIRPVIKISTKTHSIVCTPDHEIYTPKGWVAAENLSVDDLVIMNGEIRYFYNKAVFLDDKGNEIDPVCKRCGNKENIVREKGSKFIGYCRKCMYKLRSGKVYKDTDTDIHKRVDSDGYVKLFGYPLRFHPVRERYERGEGIYEHHYVWYENTGHLIDTSIEEIHHKNGVKTDNRFENLQLVTHTEHQKIHTAQSISHLPQNHADAEFYYAHGVKIMLVPKEEEITSIEVLENPEHVYDVTINDPVVHNFVCNHFIVHNCGKSLSVLNIALYFRQFHQMKHCLIIACVNSAKYNWKEDIYKHTDGQEDPYILGTRLRRDKVTENLNTGGDEKLEDLLTLKKYGKKDGDDLPFFLVLNIEAVRKKQGKKYVIADRISELINNGYIGMIALDEIHRNASMSSIQGRKILDIKKACNVPIQWIPMTGTPIVSKPTDVFLPLRLVDGHQSNSYYSWCQKYCIYGGFGGHEIIGYQNIPDLKNLLQPNMLRRLKKDVLDLPPKIHFTEYVDNTPYQQSLYNKLLAEASNDWAEKRFMTNALAGLLRLRQVNGSPELVDDHLTRDDKDYLSKNAKLARALDLIEDIVTQDEKVVVFSNWVEPLRTLYKFVKARGIKTCCYTGTMSQEDRELHKQTFINNPEYKVILGTVGALGTSHTLTVARNVIFYDSPWSPADVMQCEDRCHRPGTNQSVNIYTLVTKDTVDEKVHQILSRKEGTSQYIVDNNLDLRSHPELMDWLLKK